MRVIFVNLHTNTMIMRNARYLLTGQKAIDKHAFLVEWALDNNIEIINYVTSDFTGSTLPFNIAKIFGGRFQLKANILESKFVISKSKFRNAKIITITDPSEIREDDIIIFYGHFTNSQKCTDLGNKGIRVGDYIHFYGDIETSNIMKSHNINYYVFEVNLEKYCGIYKKYYNWFHGGYINRKYAFQPRFMNIKPYNKRINKALAIGTLTTCDYPEYIDYFGNNVYQPKRKMIYDNQEFLSNEIDSLISEYQEVRRKVVNDHDLKIIKIFKKLYNYFTNGNQKKYFSFDMVQKFNDYKMFICPEDAIGAYGIGSIEGMACGCAMIGWDYGAYEDLGLVSGVHYISYDGTLDNLKEVIDFYMKEENQRQLEAIARNGCDFIRNQFSQEKVASEYFEILFSLKK